jgi:uncharacterized delta-60 repeat protein
MIGFAFWPKIVKFMRFIAYLLILAGILASPVLAATPGAVISDLALGSNQSIRIWEGSLDDTFQPGLGATENPVDAMALQPDGRVLIGGSFSAYDGMPAVRLARIMPDGAFDATFTSHLDESQGVRVRAIALQEDKIIILGDFSTYQGAPRNGLVRLNSDGSLDTSFDPGEGASATQYSILVQMDGRILIGGTFEEFNGEIHRRLVRLNDDGSLDPSFNPFSNASFAECSADRVQALAQQSWDGKILVGGYFPDCEGQTVPRQRFFRFNTDGSLDEAFGPGLIENPYSQVYSIVVQPDHKILLAGGFNSYNGVLRENIARVMPDGSNDASFDPGDGPNNPIYTMALQRDGKILIGGGFDRVNGFIRNSLARLLPNGSLDSHFDPGAGADDRIRAMALQPDGRVLIAGSFTTYDNVMRIHVARVNSYGFFLYLSLITRP